MQIQERNTQFYQQERGPQEYKTQHSPPFEIQHNMTMDITSFTNFNKISVLTKIKKDE